MSEAVKTGPKDIDVTPAILAEWLGCSRYKAIREMRRVEREHPGVVQRRGSRHQPVASASRLRPLIPGLVPTALEAEVARLRSKLDAVDQRLDAEVKARLEFQRQASEWIARATRAGENKNSSSMTAR